MVSYYHYTKILAALNFAVCITYLKLRQYNPEIVIYFGVFWLPFKPANIKGFRVTLKRKLIITL